MTSRKSKYNRNDLKHISSKIENLENEEDYENIFNILMDDPSNIYTENSNGVFINLSTVNDITVDRLTKYLRKVDRRQRHNKSKVEEESDADTIPTFLNSETGRTYKLSNYEKNIIKQHKLKKVLNEDNEYEELQLDSKTSKKKQPKRKPTVSKKQTTMKSNKNARKDL